MPFDSSIPADHSPLASSEMRGQFNALKTLIDTLGGQIATTVAGSSANSNDVQPLAITVSDPPTQAEVQAILDKVNELILALRRV